ncbi:MAG: hypothetical protein V2A58_01650, partial [Planctomycetota bacterium]
IRYAAEVIAQTLFTNRYVWHADPDILSVRSPLSVEEARAWATIFGITGVFLASSDKLAKLPAERLAILRKVLPPADILPMDLSPWRVPGGDLHKRFPPADILTMDAEGLGPPSIWNLAVRRPFDRWNVAAVFNWNPDAPKKETVSFAELGLKRNATYLIFDFWNEKFLGEHRGSIALDLPARACRVLALHEKRDEPQLLSTSRHITQGAVSIRSLRWNAPERVLSGVSDLIKGKPYDLFIHVPKGLRVSGVCSDADRATPRRLANGIVRLRLAHNATTPRRWALRFAAH